MSVRKKGPWTNFKTMWDYFRKSLNINTERLLGEYKGEDHLGNKYYEVGPDPQGGRARASRWFECDYGDYANTKIPPEWESWLRRKRDDPPTKEEVIRNMATARMKEMNAEKIRERFQNMQEAAKPRTNAHGDAPEYPRKKPGSTFPDYGGFYEKVPGQHLDRD